MALATTLDSAAVPRRRGGGIVQATASLLLGAGITLALFLGIAHFDRSAQGEAPAEIMEIRAVSLQEPPPPPREVHQEQTIAEVPMAGFDAAPTDSPVQIAVTPPDLRDLIPQTMAPPAEIQVGQLYHDLKPKIDINFSADHVYQMVEVDQLPRVLNRVNPTVPPSVRQNASMLRTSLLFVVDADGQIKNVRVVSTSGNPDFDAIIMKNILEWSFSPAVRKGVKVRCLLQQAVIIKWNSASVFEI
ncbi:MAG TPA: TonB family protein [Lacunisphaera sp.]|nr:TonB family protein [Lacunisphaera sp.]